MEVYNENGSINNNLENVLHKWKEDFKSLYNIQNEQEHYDHSLVEQCNNHKCMLLNNMEDPFNDIGESYNQIITKEEVEQCIMSSKNNKAAGYDNIPNEVLKNSNIIDVLYRFFQLCFDSGKTPNDWNYAIISPIPKDVSKDKRVPCNYRGISLLCCISKIYSKILNKRLLEYAETNNLLCDEQNGFRSERSCVDHIFVLNSVIRNRLNEGKDTFAAFIDFKKAFDFVNRDLLMYRLLLCGVRGKLYHSINSMYAHTFCSVRLNNSWITDWFQTSSGVKQGDNMSTTLFALYINDLAYTINKKCKGVNLGNLILKI